MSRNRISLFALSIYFLLSTLSTSALTDGSPTAPTNVKAVARTSYQPQVVITWNQAMDNVGVTRYNVYRNGTFLFSPKGVGVTYTDLEVAPGQTYTYTVQAGDGDGNNSPQSEIIQIIVSEGATSHVVSEQASLPDTTVITTVPMTTTVYSNTSITEGTSQIANPENVGMVAYENQLTITWKNPKGNQFKSVRVIKKATSYPVSTTDGSVICDGLKEQCIDKDVVPGKVYYYGVYAVDQSYLASRLITVSGSLVEKKVITNTPVATSQAVNTAAVPSGAVSFTKTLKLGSVGEEVLMLQKFLNNHGFVIATSGPGSQGNETTIFGRATEKALRAYQCQKKIVCEGSAEETGYGMVGKTTRMNLNKDSLAR